MAHIRLVTYLLVLFVEIKRNTQLFTLPVYFLLRVTS